MLSTTYLLLFIFIVCIEVTRKKSNILDFLLFFHISFVIFYIFPGFVLSKLAESSSSHSFYFQSNLQVLFAIYLGYFLVLIGFYSSSAIKLSKKIEIKKYNNKTIIKFANYLIIFAIISILIYSAQYGGFLKAISQSAAIRSGRVEGGSLVLFKKLFPCAEYASYLLASLVFFSQKNKNNGVLLFKFFLSIILSVITMLMKSSRSSIIRYFVSFILAYIIYRKKIPWISIIIGVILSIAVIQYGDPLFASLSSIPDGYDSFMADFSNRLEFQASESSGSYLEDDLTGDFSYPLYSLDTAFNNQYELRLFSDFIIGFATLFPERLIPIKTPDGVSYLNTFLFYGHNNVNFPPGFLALGIYSMSWMGLVMICLFYGWLGRYMQTVLSQDKNNHPWISFLYVIIMNMWSGLLSSGDPEIVVQGNTVFVLSIFFIFSFSPKKNYT
jgi:oligosaccharide repeat unit polymerase